MACPRRVFLHASWRAFTSLPDTMACPWREFAHLLTYIFAHHFFDRASKKNEVAQESGVRKMHAKRPERVCSKYDFFVCVHFCTPTDVHFPHTNFLVIAPKKSEGVTNSARALTTDVPFCAPSGVQFCMPNDVQFCTPAANHMVGGYVLRARQTWAGRDGGSGGGG